MNLNQKFSILFFPKKSKTNTQGITPIFVRITIDGTRTEFSTLKQIQLTHWDYENAIAHKSCPDAKALNEFLVLMKANITKHYHIQLTIKEHVTVDDVRNSFKDIKPERTTFFYLFDQFLLKMDERKEIDDLSEGRHERFNILRGKCLDFLMSKGHTMLSTYLDELKLNFIVEFSHYLRTVQKIGHNTAMKYAKDLKQVMRFGVMMGYLSTSPFEFFKCTYKKVKREYLNDTELELLYNKEFKIKRLEEVRDCYIFSCYTGYAYSDAEALTGHNISTGIDGEKWIIRDRVKTDTVENVPLLPIPLEIINRYKNHDYCKVTGKLLPMNSNQRYNAYLKEIADICGIKKRLTTHTARHTFATTVALTNDVPMETVMELLGHTDIRTTQIYGKVVQKKISDDMNKLKGRLLQATKR